MSRDDLFEVVFSIQVPRDTAWRRLTETPSAGNAQEQMWLPGFDSSVTVVEADAQNRLRVTKDDEPCAGTNIVVTLEDDSTGTRVHVTQSGFGDWLDALGEMMEVGWRLIIADLRVYLATGVHARRFLSAWVDLGADTTAADGGVRLDSVHPGGRAAQLGLVDDDLLVALDGAPVTSYDDLLTILRATGGAPTAATWVRNGSLMNS